VRAALHRLFVPRIPAVAAALAEEVATLDAQAAKQQAIAQEVEAKLLRGAIRHVTSIGFAPRVGIVFGLHHADRQTQRLIDGAHQVGVALCEIVVDRREVRPLTDQRM
jgi:hypothetical protein